MAAGSRIETARIPYLVGGACSPLLFRWGCPPGLGGCERTGVVTELLQSNWGVAYCVAAVCAKRRNDVRGADAPIGSDPPE
jgi:hypothetical protein